MNVISNSATSILLKIDIRLLWLFFSSIPKSLRGGNFFPDFWRIFQKLKKAWKIDKNSEKLSIPQMLRNVA